VVGVLGKKADIMKWKTEREKAASFIVTCLFLLLLMYHFLSNRSLKV